MKPIFDQYILPLIGTAIAALCAWLATTVRAWVATNIKQKQLGVLVKFALDTVAKFGPDIQQAIQNKQPWPQLRAKMVADLEEQAGPFIQGLEDSVDLGHFIDTAVKKIFGIDPSNPAPAVGTTQTAMPVAIAGGAPIPVPQPVQR